MESWFRFIYISKVGSKFFDQVMKYFKTVITKYPFKNYLEGHFDTDLYYSEMITPIGSSHLYMRRFVYTTQVLVGHLSNTGDVFQCLASENERKMAAFSEKLKILLNFLIVEFWYPARVPVHSEWGPKNGTFLHIAVSYHVCAWYVCIQEKRAFLDLYMFFKKRILK